MQRFLVVYQGISHHSLEFCWFTHEPLGECVYRENTYDKWDTYSMVYHERALHNYFIPYHRKYSDHHNQCGIWVAHDGKAGCNNVNYYLASSVSGHDESNPVLWLAIQAGKMELSCPLRTTRRLSQEKFLWKPYNKSFIDQTCSVKMAGYCPCSFFASLWTSTPSRSINTQKKNLANIQPSWPNELGQ